MRGRKVTTTARRPTKKGTPTKITNMKVKRRIGNTATEGSHGHGHEHGEHDPHVWQDPNNAVVMVENVRDALIEADPDNEDAYRQNAEGYIGQLEDLDAEILKQVEIIPEENRKLVTGHQVFAYFAEEYGFEIPGNCNLFTHHGSL